ncbi:MAG: short-chain dehydrogenase/reductase [Caulobacteraceae bacterium]|nr:short-chain dehydrogenase/reductase [Caulobacteraceae bacterium]
MVTPLQDAHTQQPSVAGRRILVTGGTTGIGRATAALLAAEGARIFVFGRHDQQLQETLDRIAELGGEGYGITADVSKADDVERVFAAVDERLGGLDVLINNAAIEASGVADTDDKDWRYTVETNLLGYLACAKAAVPRLEAAGDGHFVLVGSVSADVYSEGSSVYVATKAAIQGFALAFRKEMAKRRLRVSLVEPGLVGADLQGWPSEKQRENIHAEKSLRAEDIAVAIHYLLSQPHRTNVVSLRIEPLMQSQS